MNVTMFTPVRDKCGVSDHTRQLVAALPDTMSIVRAPEIGGNRAGLKQRFAALGSQMNGGDIAHIQHQYFLFGGVAPHKNHAHHFLKQVRVRIVLTVHEIVEPKPTQPLLFRFALNITNRRNFLSPGIGAYIVHTTADIARLASLGVLKSKIHRIPLGIPAPLPAPAPADAKRLLDLEGKRVLTLFGFLASKKGHQSALNALRHLPDDVALIFAGGQHSDDTSDYVPTLRAQIEADSLQERVRMTGYIAPDEVPVWMAATDLALTPFVETSGSASLAQMLAYGVPTLASEIPPHREIAAECTGIQLTATNNAEAFAAAIRALLDDQPKREAMRTGARDYAQRHSFTQIAHQTHELYQQIKQIK